MKRNKTLTEHVGFRLDEETYQLLAEQGAERNMGTNDMARCLVSRALQDAEAQASLHEILSLIRLEVQELRQDLSLSTEALLTSAGKVEEKEAKTWIAENLNPKTS